MEFDNRFEVPVPVDEAWKVLMDIPRIAPCLPGAELTEVVDASTFKGKVSVRLGPVALTFAGTAKIENRDDVNHSARVKAQGADSKGRGGANAEVDFRLVPAGTGSAVLIHTNLNLSGSVAQYGRGVGMIADLSSALIKQFATCLETRVFAAPVAAATAPAGTAAPAATAGTTTPAAPASAPQAAPPAPPPAPVKPISGFSLGFQVMWNAFLRWLRGLFGGAR